MSDHSGFKKIPLGGEHNLPHDGREPADDSPLTLIDRLIATTRDGDPNRFDLFRLRRQVEENDLTLTEARAAIEKLDEVIKKVTAPANRIGTFLGMPKKDLAHVAVGGHDYFTNIDPRLDVKELKIGTRVLVNEAYVVVGDLGYDTAGPVGKITDALKDGRLRVGQEHGAHSVIVQRATDLLGKDLKSGDEIRIDPAFRVAVELLTSSEKKDFYLDDVPELAWSSIGGQTDALNAIKDAIELPLIHGDLFERFKYAQPKGFLLHGPPGCGKTLIGKATAFNLTKKLREKTGQEMKECFMHVKGPEILNMWVGESERIVREIFVTAREKRRQGFLPFLFIDEAESILGVRRASRYSNILSTLVPMFCSEMDGIESLHDVVIILASNRADLIDPAILRPGRIDRKIKVNRPNKEGAHEIFGIYLNDELPLAVPAQQMVEGAIKALFNHRDENRFLEVHLRSGRKDVLYRGDLLSGAIIESIVARAKEIAIKHSIDAHKEQAITEADLRHALDMEFSQNDIFPPTDIVEDWLMLLDYDPENVVKVSPIRPQTGARAKGVSAVV